MGSFDDDTRGVTRPERDGRPLWLIVVHETGLDSHALPADGSVVIGRARECAVVVADDSLSRRHAALWVGAGGHWIEDLGSRNGTRVGERICRPGERVPVRVGEPMSLGDATLIMRVTAPAEGPKETRSIAPSEVVDRVARSDINVLIVGETGAGKEVLARTLHERSLRAARPLVAINCAAFAESLLDSELFGYERGAFTGADKDKPGILESAESGTVFLDEIGEMPLSLQVKLLRVIELKQVQRLGALRPRQIDVRFLSATHRDLEAEVERGVFRQDLLFRLNAMALTVPPLRERVAEIEPLANQFVNVAAARMKFDDAPRVAKDALDALLAYAWPGNIRELRNVMERAVVLCRDGVITARDLPLDKMMGRRGAAAPLHSGAIELDPTLLPAMDRRSAASRAVDPEDERRRVLEALEKAEGNQTEAARLLGISRRTLVSRLKEYDLQRRR